MSRRPSRTLFEEPPQTASSAGLDPPIGSAILSPPHSCPAPASSVGAGHAHTLCNCGSAGRVALGAARFHTRIRATVRLNLTIPPPPRWGPVACFLGPAAGGSPYPSPSGQRSGSGASAAFARGPIGPPQRPDRAKEAHVSTTTVAVIREAYEAYAQGDVATMLSFVDPDLEWTFLDPSEPDPAPQVCHGRHELEVALGRQTERGLRVELEEVVGS